METRTSISIKDLEVGYNPQEPLLPRFSVDANLGELVALVGRNGIGKSTLLRSIIGLQQPLFGQILVEGIRTALLHRKQRAKALSYVPAEPVRVANLFVRDFVAVGRFPHLGWSRTLASADWQMVDYALNIVGIDHLAGRDITTISDGERQRAMIAFALAQDTRIIVLDEPTAFLDLPNKYEMVNLLSHLAHAKGKTIVYSTHDLQGAMHEADTIWMMLPTGFTAGAPEDLALQNCYQNLLLDTKVEFDSEQGMFRNKRKASKTVALEGNGMVYTWTARMLERVGCTVDNSNEATLKIVCNTHHSGYEWTVLQNNKLVFKVQRLADLAWKLRVLL